MRKQPIMTKGMADSFIKEFAFEQNSANGERLTQRKQHLQSHRGKEVSENIGEVPSSNSKCKDQELPKTGLEISL